LRVVSDFMLDAVPYSCLSMAVTSLIWRPGGTYSDTSSVPLPSFLASVSSDFLSLNFSSDVRFVVVVVLTVLCLPCLTVKPSRKGVDKSCRDVERLTIGFIMLNV